MFTMDAWDVVLYGLAVLVAVTTLVRLMSARRRDLVDEVQQQWSAERQRQEKEKKKQSKDAA